MKRVALLVASVLFTSIAHADSRPLPPATVECPRPPKRAGRAERPILECPAAPDMHVDVTCPACPADAPAKREDAATSDPWIVVEKGVEGFAKLIALIAVLFAAGWFFRLASKLISFDRLSLGVTELMYFRKHWGGFGGESSGWHVSAPLGACIAGVVLMILGASLAAGTLVVLTRPDGEKDSVETSEAQEEAETETVDAEKPREDDVANRSFDREFENAAPNSSGN